MTFVNDLASFLSQEFHIYNGRQAILAPSVLEPMSGNYVKSLFISQGSLSRSDRKLHRYSLGMLTEVSAPTQRLLNFFR